MTLVSDFIDSKGIYNNYSSASNYKLVLFRANKIVQSQELNNLQMSLREDISSILSKTYSNIDILKGGLLQFLETTVELSETQIYLEGQCITVESKQINRSLIVNESIGIKLHIKEITKAEDELLLDKNPLSRNSNSEGANRIQIYGTWEILSDIQEDETFYSIFIFKNSKIQNTSNISVLDKPEFLRKYDFNTNGNYVIEGFDILYKDEEYTNFVDNGNFKNWISTSQHKNPGGAPLEFIPNWLLSTDQTSADITRQEFDIDQTEVPNFPAYYASIEFDSLVGSFTPEISCRVYPIDLFSFKQIQIAINLKSSVSTQVRFKLVQNFGAGGSGTIEKDLGIFTIPTSWNQIDITTLVPSTQGKIIGAGAYMSLALYLVTPINITLSIAETSLKNLFLDKGDFYLFSVREGIASVSGSEIVINTNKELRIPVGTDLKMISGEPFEFIANTTYELRNASARNIVRIIGQKEILSENVVHGSFTSSSDLLTKTPVFSVSSISQGATTYIQGIDYVLSGDSIDWSLAGAEPAPGSTYQVTYRYVEYNIIYSYNPYLNTFTIQDQIIPNTTFYADYNVTIPRYDRVVLNKYGIISSIQGNPNFDQIYSYISSEKGLHLADIEILYKQTPKIHLVYNRPYKLSDINFLYNTVRDISESIKALKLSTKSFNSLYTGGEEHVEFSDSFNDRSTIFDQQNSICDIYKNKCTSKVTFETLELTHDKNTLPSEEINFIDTLSSKNSILELNSNLLPDDGLAYFELDKYRITWLSDSSKKIIFRDEDAIRDYQTFGKLSSDLNESFSLEITGYGYGNSEILEIVVDNEIHSAIKSQPNGEFISTIQIASSTVQSGKRKIEVRGLDSKKTFSDIVHITSVDGRSFVNAYRTYPSKSFINEEFSISNLSSKESYYTNTSWLWKANPCFQTLSFEKDLILSSIDLHVQSSSDIYVAIGETTNELPDPNKVIGYSYLKVADVIQNDENSFKFKNPIFVEANKTYFISISNSNGPLSISLNDLSNERSLKDKNLKAFYQSINNSVLVKKDFTQIALKLNQFDFKADSFNINDVTIERDIGTISVEGITDFSILSGIYSVDSTSVSFKITLIDRSEESYILEPYSNIYFQSYTGLLKISAIFKSYNFELSSWIDSNLLVCLGQLEIQSKYETKLLDFVGNRITAAITVYSDSDSSIQPSYWNGSNYEILDEDLVRSEDLGNNLKILYFYKDLAASLSETKLKIDLISNSNGSRPTISDLRFWYNIPFGGSEYIQFTPSGDINIQNGKIVNLSTGTAPTDAVNLQQLNDVSDNLVQYVNTSLTNLQSTINAYIESYVDQQISQEIQDLSTSLQTDYNTKISQLSNALNLRIGQEVQTLETQIIDSIDQATITINQTTQTQIAQLQSDLTQLIQSQIDQAETDLLNSVNASLSSQVESAVNAAMGQAGTNILLEVDNRISTANSTLQNTLEDYADQQIAILQTQTQNSITILRDSLLQNEIPGQINATLQTLGLSQLENSQSYQIYDGNNSETAILIEPITRIQYYTHIVNSSTSTNVIKIPNIGNLRSGPSYQNFNFNFLLRFLNFSEQPLLIVDQSNAVLFTVQSQSSLELKYSQTTGDLLPLQFIEKIESNAKDYLLSSLAPTKIELIRNDKFIQNHIILSPSPLTFNLLDLTEIIALKSSFSPETTSFVFSINNLSNDIITIKSPTIGDKIEMITYDNLTVVEILLDPKTSITFMFLFSTNKLYEI